MTGIRLRSLDGGTTGQWSGPSVRISAATGAGQDAHLYLPELGPDASVTLQHSPNGRWLVLRCPNVPEGSFALSETIGVGEVLEIEGRRWIVEEPQPEHPDAMDPHLAIRLVAVSGDLNLTGQWPGPIVRIAAAADGGDLHLPFLAVLHGRDAYVDLVRQPDGTWLVNRVPSTPDSEPERLARGEILEVLGQRWVVDEVPVEPETPQYGINLTVTYGPPPDGLFDGGGGARSRWLLVGLAVLAASTIGAGAWWIAR